MKRLLPLIFLNTALGLGLLILLLWAPNFGDEHNTLLLENQKRHSQNATLQMLSQKLSPQTLGPILKNHQAIAQNPKEGMRTWAQQFHIDLKSITVEGSQIEVSFKAPLDTDVYQWVEDLEKNCFMLLSFGLYRDKVNHGVEGRCIIKTTKNG